MILFYKEIMMYQITKRSEGQCCLCDSREQVVTLTKVPGKPMDLCRRHLWEALKGEQKKAETQ
jgi:hypothetical protein